MPTQAQIDANRRNVQKSTGPISAEGKAASSTYAAHWLRSANCPLIRGNQQFALARESGKRGGF